MKRAKSFLLILVFVCLFVSWLDGVFVCLLPLQVWPSPVYPALHLQEYEPTVFMQSALTSQLWVWVVHSSRSKINRDNIEHMHPAQNTLITFPLFLGYFVTLKAEKRDISVSFSSQRWLNKINSSIKSTDQSVNYQIMIKWYNIQKKSHTCKTSKVEAAIARHVIPSVLVVRS